MKLHTTFMLRREGQENKGCLNSDLRKDVSDHWKEWSFRPNFKIHDNSKIVVYL
jgi:hypothetical protein